MSEAHKLMEASQAKVHTAALIAAGFPGFEVLRPFLHFTQ